MVKYRLLAIVGLASVLIYFYAVGGKGFGPLWNGVISFSYLVLGVVYLCFSIKERFPKLRSLYLKIALPLLLEGPVYYLTRGSLMDRIEDLRLVLFPVLFLMAVHLYLALNIINETERIRQTEKIPE